MPPSKGIGGFFRNVVSRINRGIRNVLGTPEEQPPPRFPPVERGPAEPPPSFPGDVLPPLGAEQPPDYGVYGPPPGGEPVYEGPPTPPWYGNEVMLTDDYGNLLPEGGGWTANDWFRQSLEPVSDTLEKFGIDNVDIIFQLIDQGYDYDWYDEKGKRHSGLFRDWHEAGGENS